GAQSIGELAGSNRIDDGLWHQLAAVYNGSNSESLYVDGQLAASSASATAPVVGNTDDVWIGGNPDGGAFQWFDGLVDEVAIFTNALTTLQIQQLYNTATNAPFAF